MKVCQRILHLKVKLLTWVTADFANQGAYELARRYDPQGKRTVGRYHRVYSVNFHLPSDILGVLTKPDRSPEAAHERWTQYITGDIEPLEHGWYCVKLPDTQSGHPQPPTLLEAREQEYQWFKKTSPWPTLPSQAQRRLGTKRLVRQLETILSNLISNKYAMIYIFRARRE